MKPNKEVSKELWVERRRELLVAEKAAMRQLDEVAQQRRELPWVRIEKKYVFETENGMQSLSDLFGSNSQLITYHFMYGPGWKEGCLGCSFVCDHFDGANLHLANHDVSLVCVSRAKLDEYLSFKQRMGWKFPWVSSAGSEFNYDFGASFTTEQVESGEAFYNYETTAQVMDEMQGLSVFSKDESGAIYHTYSTYARGLDLLLGAHNLLDLTPNGRNEQGVMNWVRHHDRYGVDGAASFPTDESTVDQSCDKETCCTEKESL